MRLMRFRELRVNFEGPRYAVDAVAEVGADDDEKGDGGEQRKATAKENYGECSDRGKEETH